MTAFLLGFALGAVLTLAWRAWVAYRYVAALDDFESRVGAWRDEWQRNQKEGNES